jgi:UDP-N-acetylglucosamine acyltransferase
MAIHQSAIIDKRTEIGNNNEIGPNVIIEGPVCIGDNNIISAGSLIKGRTTIGNNNHIYSYAMIGEDPQDISFSGAETETIIGNGNTIREFVTIHRATSDEMATRVGDNNYLMGHSHLAHDVVIGDSNYLANTASLAGHAELGSFIFISFAVGIHQFARIGSYVMLGSHSKVGKDVLPFMTVDGNPALVRGLNLLGLKRNGFTPDRRKVLKNAYMQLFRSGANLKTSIVALKSMIEEAESDEQVADLRMLSDFIKNSKRGILLKSPKDDSENNRTE